MKNAQDQPVFEYGPVKFRFAHGKGKNKLRCYTQSITKVNDPKMQEQIKRNRKEAIKLLIKFGIREYIKENPETEEHLRHLAY